MGGLLGLFFHERQKINGGEPPRPEMNPKKGTVYLLCAFLIFLVAFLLPYAAYSDVEQGVLGELSWGQGWIALLTAVEGPLYSVGLYGLCHMLCDGNGGFIRDILSMGLFGSLSQLAYGAFLWAPILLLLHDSSALSVNYISYKHVVFGQQSWMSVGCITFAFLMSGASFLLIEKPSLVLARRFMGYPLTKFKFQNEQEERLHNAVSHVTELQMEASPAGGTGGGGGGGGMEFIQAEDGILPSMGGKEGGVIAAAMSVSPRQSKKKPPASPSSKGPVDVVVT